MMLVVPTRNQQYVKPCKSRVDTRKLKGMLSGNVVIKNV